MGEGEDWWYAFLLTNYYGIYLFLVGEGEDQCNTFLITNYYVIYLFLVGEGEDQCKAFLITYYYYGIYLFYGGVIDLIIRVLTQGILLQGGFGCYY